MRMKYTFFIPRQPILTETLSFIEISRKPRSVNGDECRFCFGTRKLPVFREAVKPRLVGGDRSHGATFFIKNFSSEFVFLEAGLNEFGILWFNGE
jgi:hypothetical protein